MASAASTPRATVLGAFLEGARRVSTAPVLLLGIAVTTAAVALPHSLSPFSPLTDTWHLRTLMERALSEFHLGWALAFGQRTTPAAPALGGSALVLWVLWTFLSGGILDRLARARPIRTPAFFAACGEYFVRFLRLAVIVGPFYWWLFAWLHPYLLSTMMQRWMEGVTERKDIVAVQVTLHLLFVAAVAVVNLVADFARVRAVVEDRRSMLGAIAAALRFMRRRPIRVAGVYLLGALPTLAVLRLWYGASAVPDAGATYMAAILLMYVVVRVWAKLVWMASQVVFFQGELAHATYTAAPLPIWPDSPAAEAIDNLRRNS